MVRVLHMIGSLEIGGSQTLIMNIYRKIDRTNLQFDFIVDHPDRMYFAKEITELGGKIYTILPFKGYNLLQVKRAWKNFFQNHPDYKIFHSHVRSYASIYLPIAKKNGLKTIIHSHNTSNGSGVTAIIKFLLQFPLRYQADYYMACSKMAGKWLFGKKVIGKPYFHIIANGIDVNKYCFSSDKRDQIRNEFKISKNTFVLGYLARVVPQKNPLFVIEVFKRMMEINASKEMKLLFIGDGELLQEVKLLAEYYSISNNIIFTGSRTDVPELMMAMDLYILPSIWEGFGISLIEAQATGLKCLCSENIQKEPIVSNLVTRTDLKDKAEKWASIAIKLSSVYSRKNMTQTLIDAGYDISCTSTWIANFYLDL